MPTERQIEASRANGAKSRGPVTPEGKLKSLANSALSTGPRTPEGKARSSLNAVRHGLLAKSIVLNAESREMFLEILAAYEEELQPDDEVEIRLVESMATSEWRRLRLLAMEKDHLDMEMERQQQASLETAAPQTCADPANPAPGQTTGLVKIDPGRDLVRAFQVITSQSRMSELMSRYENRHDRQYMRSLAALRAHRAGKSRLSADIRADGKLEKRRQKDRLRKQKQRRLRKIANRPDQTK